MYNLFKYLEKIENRDIPLSIRIIHNIDLYYEDKSLIKDDEVLEVLDKAYNWLYSFLTDDLDNLKAFEPKDKELYDVIYGYSKHNLILAYNKINRWNHIDYKNLFSKLLIHIDYKIDYDAIKSIIQAYLVNVLGMKGGKIHSTFWNFNSIK